jgi:hypothetical protein
MSTAVLFDRYGTPDELYVTEEPVPSAGPGEVVVRYTAIGVNPIDWKILHGALKAYLPLDLPGACLGVEAAGVIVEVGARVRRFRVGDRVIRHGRPGTFRVHCDADLVEAAGNFGAFDLTDPGQTRATLIAASAGWLAPDTTGVEVIDRRRQSATGADPVHRDPGGVHPQFPGARTGRPAGHVEHGPVHGHARLELAERRDQLAPLPRGTGRR